VFVPIEEMDIFCIPLYSLYLASICFSQKIAKWGDCWVFVLAALLLKQISMYVLLEQIFQHGSGIYVRCWTECSNILAWFSVAEFLQCMCARLILFKETIFLYIIDQATRISLHNQLWNIPKVVIIF